MHARSVDPQVAAVAHFHQETVAVHRILDLDFGFPPIPAVDGSDQGCDGKPRFAVGVRACANRGDGPKFVRNPDPNAHVFAEGWCRIRDKQRRAVVVRLKEGSGHEGRHGKHLCTRMWRADFTSSDNCP